MLLTAPAGVRIDVLLTNVCAGFVSFCCGACGAPFALGLVGASRCSVEAEVLVLLVYL